MAKATYTIDPKRLRDLRAFAFLTQEALAEASGVSLGRIKQLEQGVGSDRVTSETVKKLAKALQCSPSYLANPNDAEVAS